MAYTVEQYQRAIEAATAAGDEQAARDLTASMAAQMRVESTDIAGPSAALASGATLGVLPRMVPPLQESLEAFRETSPGAATGLEALGGLGIGAGVGAGVARLGQQAGQVGRLGRWLGQTRAAPQATLGAAEGAVYGAMQGEGSLPVRTGVGAVLGGVGGAASAPISRGLTSRFRPGTAAEDMMRAEMAEQLGREPTAEDFARWSARAEAVPELTLAEIVGGAEGVPAWQAKALHSMGGKARTVIDETIEARRETSLPRLLGTLSSEMGTDESVAAATRRLEQQAKTDAKPLYDDAFSAPFEADEAMIASVSTTPERLEWVEKGYKAAKRSAAMRENKIYPPWKGTENEEGVIDEGLEGMSLEAWDRVKRGLDKRIGSLLRGKKADPSDAADLMAFKNELVEHIDRLAPEQYRQARAVYRGPMEQQEALELGRKVFTSDADETEFRIGEMSQAEKNAYLIGVAQEVRNKLKSVPVGGGMQRWSELAKERVQMAFPDPDAFDAFWDAITTEREMQQFRNLFKAQSKTADIQTAQERQARLRGVGQGVGEALRGDPLGGAQTVVSNVMPPRRQTIPMHIAHPLARMLMAQGRLVPQKLERLNRPPVVPRLLGPMTTTAAGMLLHGGGRAVTPDGR